MSIKPQQTEQRRRQFIQNLQLLNDVLATTPLVDHYWLWGGVLLGWAREGQVLAHDDNDADFAYFAQDHDKFLAAVPALCAAGFQPYRTWTNSAGHTTEYVLRKDGAVFDFFEFQQQGERAAYWLYASTFIKKAWLELYSEPPLTQFDTMRFLERTWRKPADHEAVLAAVYGDWRTPDPNYRLTEGKSIVRKTLWVGKGEPVTYMQPEQQDFDKLSRKSREHDIIKRT